LREAERALALAGTGATVGAGFSALVEMTYHLQLNEALGPRLRHLGATLDASSTDAWVGAAFVTAVGAALFELARRRFVAEWAAALAAIEHDAHRHGGRP
jgi:branched-chain amino acid transport system permease protein